MENQNLLNKNILIGITGGIATYKICNLIRIFKKLNINVKVVATENALNFITKTTLRTLSQNDVYCEQFADDWKPEHISLVNWADIFVIAPATANTIAKIANGICDNLLTSTACAFNKNILIAPAMNTNMWNNEITQQNIQKLKSIKKFNFIDPTSGFLACNCEGQGRLADVEDIANRAIELLKINNSLKGKKIIVTAGGTKERIDPIRCISNYSSGKMGIAVADEAYNMGADVILISTVKVEKPYKVIQVESTIDILEKIKENFTDANLIMTASISDFRPETVSPNKIKKNGSEGLTIKLVQNPDILKTLAPLKKEGQIIVGFSAETENIIENSIKKLENKNLDYIAVNDVSRKDIGFNVDYNEITLIDKNKNQYKIDRDTKHNIAKKILNKVFNNEG